MRIRGGNWIRFYTERAAVVVYTVHSELERRTGTLGQATHVGKEAGRPLSIKPAAHIGCTIPNQIKVGAPGVLPPVMAVDLRANTLSKQMLTKFVDESIESCGLVERNLGRAAQLVRSFKQVSVDRTSDGRRTFHMNAFLIEIVDSLKLPWRHCPIRFDTSCAPDITLESFPGALGQVIFNLIQNAVIHGIGADNEGVVAIDARPHVVAGVQIEVSDDGVGIAEENFEKVFEPFFTTRRGEGGSGLGLHIVHNLVSHKLGGTIQLGRTGRGRGCCFTMVIPYKAP